jgi:WD40 repeat protein
MRITRCLQSWPCRLSFLGYLLLLCLPVVGQGSGLGHWNLDVEASDADFSPDGHFVALTRESPAASQIGHSYVAESVEVWDYRAGKKINGAELPAHPRTAHTPDVVRFTADGALLVVSEPTTLHVLDALTLKAVRVIEPPLDHDFRIFHVETGPAGHVAVVGANYNFEGILAVYNLDDGSLLFQSKVPHGISSISWKPDGSEVALANPFPCTWSRNTVEIFATNPWSHLRTLRARNPASVAFSSDKLYLVESGFCKGSAFDRHLGLEAFDIREWRRQKTLFLDQKDIHDSVSFANGILVGDTGALKIQHDWLDATTMGVPVGAQFTVWKGEVPSVWFTSPELTMCSHWPQHFRLSRQGDRVLLGNSDRLHKMHLQVFQLP